MTELAAEAPSRLFRFCRARNYPLFNRLSFAETQERAASAILRLNMPSQSCPALLLSGFPVGLTTNKSSWI